MPSTPAQMMDAVITNLPKKTGRTLDEWIAIVLAHGQAPRKERVGWLKAEHGLGHVTAEMITDEAARREGSAPPPIADLIAFQYSGAKAHLRHLYERLAEAARALGEDVALDPRKGYVSLIRGRQFALIQPTNRTRIDVGLKLKGVPPTERLLAAPELGSGTITHRVEVTSDADIDAELCGWLLAAYEAIGNRQ